MTFLAPIDRATAAPVPALITDTDRAAEARAAQQDKSLRRTPIRPAHKAGWDFWDLMGCAVGLGLLAAAIGIFVPVVM